MKSYLYIYDDKSWLYKIRLLYIFCNHENIKLDSKTTLIEYLYSKLQWKVEFSIMAVANLHN